MSTWRVSAFFFGALAIGCASSSDDVDSGGFSALDPGPHEGEPGGAAGWGAADEPTEPEPETTCGTTGDACCGDGAACTASSGKARCCADCSGSPGYKCNCFDEYVAAGSCLVCCVVCENGFVSSPQSVSPGQTCDQVAKAFCEKKEGANTLESGWKATCK